MRCFAFVSGALGIVLSAIRSRPRVEYTRAEVARIPHFYSGKHEHQNEQSVLEPRRFERARAHRGTVVEREDDVLPVVRYIPFVRSLSFFVTNFFFLNEESLFVLCAADAMDV